MHGYRRGVYADNGLSLGCKDILPLAMTRMDLEDTVLSEVSQRRPNTIRFHSYVELKKKNQPKNQNKKTNNKKK